MKHRVFACVLALGALSSSGRAHAQESTVADPAAEARTQYGLGTQAFQAKKYSEAALHFESAASFRPHAVALYTAGLAWDLANKPERAADAFSRALDVPGLDAKQTATAKERVATLEKTLGTLAVTGGEGTKVQLDALTEAPVPARLHAPAGSHSLSVRVPGKPIDHREVTLEAGHVAELDLTKEAKPAPPPPPAEEPKPPPPPKEPPPRAHDEFWITRRVIGVGVAGLGVAALGAGAVLGINANGAKDAYDAAPTREAFDHASSLQTWTNVALIAGGVALAGGIVLVVLPDGDSGEARLQMGLGPSGAAIGGRF